MYLANALFIKVNQITPVNDSEQHSVISLINLSLHHIYLQPTEEKKD